MPSMYGPRQQPVKVTVTENRASTDDAIRLADEMRRETINSIIAHGARQFDAHVTWHVQDDARGMGSRVVVTHAPCSSQ